MSRGKSTRLVAELPPTYSKDWHLKLDKRTRASRVAYPEWRALVERGIEDQGGPEALSDDEIEAIEQKKFDQILMRGMRMRYFTQGRIDYGSYAQVRFSWTGTVKVLGGPKRKSRAVRTLAQQVTRGDAA